MLPTDEGGPSEGQVATGPSGRVAPLGEAVRRRRRQLGLRQSEVADLAGCSQRFVHTVEQGKPSLRLDKTLDVLEVLGLGLDIVPGRGRITAKTENSADQDQGRDERG